MSHELISFKSSFSTVMIVLFLFENLLFGILIEGIF